MHIISLNIVEIKRNRIAFMGFESFSDFKTGQKIKKIFETGPFLSNEVGTSIFRTNPNFPCRFQASIHFVVITPNNLVQYLIKNFEFSKTPIRTRCN